MSDRFEPCSPRGQLSSSWTDFPAGLGAGLRIGLGYGLRLGLRVGLDVGLRIGLKAGLIAALLLLAGGLAGPLGAAGSKPADTFSEETTTLLVEVPVEVTADGKPVRGLTAANFELFDNGRPQEIVAVDVIDLAALSAQGPTAVPQELPVAARRHFLLLFDYGFTAPRTFEKAREAAYKFVEKDLDPNDLVAVATFSTRDGVRVPLGFTPDRTQALLAIQQLGQAKTAGLKPDPLRLYMGNKSQLRDPGDDVSANKHDGGSEAAREQAQEISRAEQQGTNTVGRREVKILSDSMQALAGLMRQVNGRKHVIFFSEGFDSALLLGGQNESEAEENYQAIAAGQIWKVDSDAVFGNRSTLSALDQLTDSLRKSDCTLHSVDVAGLRAGGDLGIGAGKRGKDGLFLMARDTGGELFENFNDLGTAMTHLLEKTSVTYLLSYRPKDLDFDGKYRKLKVKLKDVADGRIVHRPGYFAPAAKNDADDFGTLLASGEQLLDRKKGDIDARVLALPLQQEVGSLRYVPTFVDVVGATLLAPQQLGRERQKELQADVFLYAFDRQGGIIDYFSQAIRLDLRQMGETFDHSGFRLYAPLLLPPGDYTLRALVRDPASGRTGVAVSQVQVSPAAAAGAAATAALLPAMLPETTEAWILVRGRRKDLEGQNEPDYPFTYASQLYAPAAQPELLPQERLPLLIAGFGLADLQLEARLLDARGSEVAPLTLTLAGSATVTQLGLIQQLVGFTVPTVAPGEYRLQLEGRHAERGVLASSLTPITIGATPAAGTTDRKLAFAAPAAGSRDLLALAQAAPQEDAAAIENSVATLREGYRAALASLRPGESLKAAFDRLEAFEQAALGDDPQGKAPRLGRAEMEVARQLAGSDLETLLPLLQAHQELFLRHKVARRAFLELHSREMVIELATLYADRGKSEGSKVVASRAISSLGGYLLADGKSAAVGLLEKAANLDPRNEAAYLGLAAYYEKRGGPYESAVAALERLIDHQPDSREGRLRLAINQLRVAKTDNVGEKSRRRSAEQLFTALLAAPENDWISSLAAQELARFEVEQGRLGEAVQVLEKTLLRRPADQEILVQLTFLYDRLEKGNVPKLLDRVTQGGGEGEAPRGRYNQWQSEALRRDRDQLQDGARQRLAILDQALSTTPTQEGR